MSFKTVWHSAFGALQKIGKALMLPVAVLPVAGILLGVGASIAGAEHLTTYHKLARTKNEGRESPRCAK